LALVLAIGGCSARSAQMATCKGPGGDVGKLQAKLAACADVIKQGARGDDLEQALAQSGDAQRQLSNPGLAIQDFSQALRLRPSDDVALNRRGLAYLDDGKPDLALADFNAAIIANPSDGDAFDNRGFVERSSSNYDAAIADESRAIELEPDAALPWANRGYAYAGKRQWDSAIADFNDALRLAQDDTFALQGRAESERGKGDGKAALRDFDTVLNDPHGEYALSDAEAVVELSPAGDPKALNARCWVRGVLDTELSAALADCEQSLAVQPNSAETLDSLALIYFRQGRYDEAVTEYSAALAADPSQTASRFMRGVAKLRAGDTPGGQSDIAAADAADKSLGGQFAGYGIRP
jgi:tetratricopeptide (TPR) repeat protein